MEKMQGYECYTSCYVSYHRTLRIIDTCVIEEGIKQLYGFTTFMNNYLKSRKEKFTFWESNVNFVDIFEI